MIWRNYRQSYRYWNWQKNYRKFFIIENNYLSYTPTPHPVPDWQNMQPPLKSKRSVGTTMHTAVSGAKATNSASTLYKGDQNQPQPAPLSAPAACSLPSCNLSLMCSQISAAAPTISSGTIMLKIYKEQQQKSATLPPSIQQTPGFSNAEQGQWLIADPLAADGRGPSARKPEKCFLLSDSKKYYVRDWTNSSRTALLYVNIA